MKKSVSNTSSNILPNNVSILDVESGLKAGSGSLPNDKVRICQRNGYPHEPIVWREIREFNEEDKTIESECFAYDYFFPSRQHIHKAKRARES
jgi:hypothetical protein